MIGKVQSYTYEDLLKEIPDLETKKFLDVGSGRYSPFSLAYFSYLHKKATNQNKKTFVMEEFKKNIVAVDLKYEDKLDCILPEVSVCADVRDLPFGNETFDIVTAGWLLDYFNDFELERVIDEVVRVLKPEGYFIGDVPLHPMRSIYESLRIPKLIIDIPRYWKQMKKYKEVMKRNNLEFLKEGIGFNSTEIDKYLTFFFITRKRKVKNNEM